MIDTNENSLQAELSKQRIHLKHGDSANQQDIDELTQRLEEERNRLMPNEKDEIFALVDDRGRPTGVEASRWLCHLLSLRHRSVHVLLFWRSPALGSVLVLQVRSWDKSDSPGHLDISVGGHIVGAGEDLWLESAFREMQEELGLKKDDLDGAKLHFQAGYEYSEKRENENFYNTEWRQVYTGEISASGLANIKFNDREVAGIYLCPHLEVTQLLNQRFLPLASALRHSLPKCHD